MADLSYVPRDALLDLHRAVMAHELAFGRRRRALVMSVCVQAVTFGLETHKPVPGRTSTHPTSRDRARDAARLLLGLAPGLDEETADDLAAICGEVAADLS